MRAVIVQQVVLEVVEASLPQLRTLTSLLQVASFREVLLLREKLKPTILVFLYFEWQSAAQSALVAFHSRWLDRDQANEWQLTGESTRVTVKAHRGGKTILTPEPLAKAAA